MQKYEENNGDFDVAILDVMMPGIDGFQVCKELRNRNGGIGIIMLSAKTQEMDKVTGLMLGTDAMLQSLSHRVSFLQELIHSTEELRLRSHIPKTTLKKNLNRASSHSIFATVHL